MRFLYRLQRHCTMLRYASFMPNGHVCLNGGAAILVFLEYSVHNVERVKIACFQTFLVSTDLAKIENVQLSLFKALDDDPLKFWQNLVPKMFGSDASLLETQIACAKADSRDTDIHQRLRKACVKSDLQVMRSRVSNGYGNEWKVSMRVLLIVTILMRCESRTGTPSPTQIPTT